MSISAARLLWLPLASCPKLVFLYWDGQLQVLRFLTVSLCRLPTDLIRVSGVMTIAQGVLHGAPHHVIRLCNGLWMEPCRPCDCLRCDAARRHLQVDVLEEPVSVDRRICEIGKPPTGFCVEGRRSRRLLVFFSFRTLDCCSFWTGCCQKEAASIHEQFVGRRSQ